MEITFYVMSRAFWDEYAPGVEPKEIGAEEGRLLHWKTVEATDDDLYDEGIYAPSYKAKQIRYMIANIKEHGTDGVLREKHGLTTHEYRLDEYERALAELMESDEYKQHERRKKACEFFKENAETRTFTCYRD